MDTQTREHMSIFIAHYTLDGVERTQEFDSRAKAVAWKDLQERRFGERFKSGRFERVR